MDFRQVSDHLLKARDHYVGSDVYVADGDGGYAPVSAVEVQEVNGRNIIVLETDPFNTVVAGDTWSESTDDPELDPPGQTYNPTGDNLPGSLAPEGDPQGQPLPGSEQTSPFTKDND